MSVLRKTLWPELRPYKWTVFYVIFLGALISGPKSVIPILVGDLAKAWEHGDRIAAQQLPIYFAIIWVCIGVLRFYHLFWMKFTASRVAINLRRRLMDKYLSLNIGFFQDFQRGSGGLISRMIHDITIIEAGIQKVSDLVREPIVVIAMFTTLLLMDWRLTLFILAALPIITWVMRRFSRSLRKYGHKNQEAMEDLTKTLKESLDGTRIVQSFNLEQEMREAFNSKADRVLHATKRIIQREEGVGPVSESLAAITIYGILVYIGTQIFSGNFSTPDFIQFIGCIILLQEGVKKIQGALIKLQQSTVALERMNNIFTSTRVVPQAKHPQSFPEDWEAIEYKNVSFSFGDRKVLDNVSVTIRRGEIIALVGSSGGGKSTFVNLLERFFDPTVGQILIGNTPIQDIHLKELRNHISLVSQDVFLFGDTIEKNIHSGDFSKPIKRIEEAARMANAHNFISAKPEGYQTRVADQGSSLSGGEKQRISIARAIFKDAPILILDEATSALDSESEREVQKGLDQLLQGRTAFVIAHRLSTIAKADRILVLKNGQIVEQGNHLDLLNKKGEYFRFHQIQAGL
ncbi:MAG: ATP-binding cassette domain-containing protein [Bdellovibrionales bacterium]|nr:ATP-binding cassette domain-containing protein [Bdellovibrionales bacterium]